MKLLKRNTSLITGKQNLEHLQTLNDIPVFFGCTDKPQTEDIKCEMKWYIDKDTGLIQLGELVPLEILYMEQHVDAVGKTWNDYYANLSEYICKNNTNNIIEIGGGSGKLAEVVLAKTTNVQYTIIEPNPLIKSSEKIKVIPSFFNKSLDIEKGSTIVFSQVLEHVYNPKEFLMEINLYLNDNNKLIFAYPDLEHWFKSKFTNAINFEHTMLLTDYYLDYLLNLCGFNIENKTKYKDHSFFYCVSKSTSTIIVPSIDNRYSHYKDMFIEFNNHYENYILKLNKEINFHKKNYYLFGAHIFAQYLINRGLDTSKLICLLDNSDIKENKRLYGTSFEVKKPHVLKDVKSPIVLLNAGVYEAEIKKQILEEINSDTIFI
jgi:2-polyprenyl-3-methyl-5-hydroxy-6-metoxy-1,4-benzoquinol methylase